MYPSLRSEPVIVRNVDIGRDGSVFDSVKSSKAKPKNDVAAAHQVEPEAKTLKTEQGRTVSIKSGSASIPPSLREPGPRLLPYWYDYDQTQNLVSLSACKESNFCRLKYKAAPTEGRHITQVELCAGLDDEHNDGMLSDSTCSAISAVAVLSSPMAGATAFYLFQALPDASVKGSVKKGAAAPSLAQVNGQTNGAPAVKKSTPDGRCANIARRAAAARGSERFSWRPLVHRWAILRVRRALARYDKNPSARQPLPPT